MNEILAYSVALVTPALGYTLVRVSKPGRPTRVSVLTMTILLSVASLGFIVGTIGEGLWRPLVIFGILSAIVALIHRDRIALHWLFLVPKDGQPSQLPYTAVVEVERILQRLARAYPKMEARAEPEEDGIWLSVDVYPISRVPGVSGERFEALVQQMCMEVPLDNRDIKDQPTWVAYVVRGGELHIISGSRDRA